MFRSTRNSFVTPFDQIKQLLNSRDFQPFVIMTDDGHARPIRSVDKILVGKNRIVVLTEDDDVFEIISGKHIVGVLTKDYDSAVQ